MRMAPPGRASNSQTGFVKRWGPHHFATIFGSVQALNTSSRGASKTRVSTNSCLSFGVMLPVAMVFLLFLCVPQVFVQTVKALGPEPLVVRQPIGDILERRSGNTARPPLRLAPACYQAGVFEDFEVPGNGGHAHGERSSQLRHRGLAASQAGEDGTASRVGKRGERCAQLVGGQLH